MRSILVLVLITLTAVSAQPLCAQEVGGVGMVLGVDRETQALKVLRVLPDAPAAKAGVKPGSILSRIGGTQVQCKTMAESVALIRGPIGSKVTLEVVEPGSHATNQVDVVREKIASTGKARLGEAASPLFVKEWVQGGPVDVKDGKA